MQFTLFLFCLIYTNQNSYVLNKIVLEVKLLFARKSNKGIHVEFVCKNPAVNCVYSVVSSISRQCSWIFLRSGICIRGLFFFFDIQFIKFRNIRSQNNNLKKVTIFLSLLSFYWNTLSFQKLETRKIPKTFTHVWHARVKHTRWSYSHWPSQPNWQL